MEIVPLGEVHRHWVAESTAEHFGSRFVISLGRLHDTSALPGLVAVDDQDATPVGFAVYSLRGVDCEIVALVATAAGRGIGRGLVSAVAATARELGCERLVLVTTNDNVGAQAFYSACGFELAATHVGAVTRAREIKPEIPLLGEGGVPIADELEYRRALVYT